MYKFWLTCEDEACTIITGYSDSEQPRESFPYQIQVTAADPIYIAYYDAQQAWFQVYLPTPIRDGETL